VQRVRRWANLEDVRPLAYHAPVKRVVLSIAVMALPACDLVFDLPDRDASGPPSGPMISATVEPAISRVPQTGTAMVSVRIEAGAGQTVSLSAAPTPSNTGEFDGASPPATMTIPANGVLDTQLGWKPLELTHQLIRLTAALDGIDLDPGTFTLEFDVDRVLGHFSPTSSSVGQVGINEQLLVALEISLPDAFELTGVGFVPSLAGSSADIAVGVFDSRADGMGPGTLVSDAFTPTITSNAPVELQLSQPLHFDANQVRWVVAMFPDQATIQTDVSQATDSRSQVIEFSFGSFPLELKQVNLNDLSATPPVLYAIAHKAP